jgi:hypothetical protein
MSHLPTPPAFYWNALTLLLTFPLQLPSFEECQWLKGDFPYRDGHPRPSFPFVSLSSQVGFASQLFSFVSVARFLSSLQIASSQGVGMMPVIRP